MDVVLEQTCGWHTKNATFRVCILVRSPGIESSRRNCTKGDLRQQFYSACATQKGHRGDENCQTYCLQML